MEPSLLTPAFTLFHLRQCCSAQSPQGGQKIIQTSFSWRPSLIVKQCKSGSLCCCLSSTIQASKGSVVRAFIDIWGNLYSCSINASKSSLCLSRLHSIGTHYTWFVIWKPWIFSYLIDDEISKFCLVVFLPSGLNRGESKVRILSH